jgi:hypothetical protein
MAVSFYGDVAPILAMHCNGCHGDSSGLSLRSYDNLLRGGNMGKVLIAGDAENSLLIQFVDGRRGEAHRMPLGGRPLSAKQIETLRRWIDEGAKSDDPVLAVKQIHRLKDVKLPARINCRVAASGYLTVEVLHPATGAVLWSETASLKSPPERNDAGAPGEWLHWQVRPAPGWPAEVNVQLSIEHAAARPDSVEFSASPLQPPKLDTPRN